MVGFLKLLTQLSKDNQTFVNQTSLFGVPIELYNYEEEEDLTGGVYHVGRYNDRLKVETIKLICFSVIDNFKECFADFQLALYHYNVCIIHYVACILLNVVCTHSSSLICQLKSNRCHPFTSSRIVLPHFLQRQSTLAGVFHTISIMRIDRDKVIL